MVTAVLSVCMIAGPAQAQVDECYPDGCTPPTDPPAVAEVACEMDRKAAQPGRTVTADVVNGGGSTMVRLLLDGDEVASELVPPPGDVTLSFVVPDLPSGGYDLVAVGDTYSVECAFNGSAGLRVGGSSQSNAGGSGAAVNAGGQGAGGAGGDAAADPDAAPSGDLAAAQVRGATVDRGFGPLPRTGSELAIAGFAAVLLVLVGRLLLLASRSRAGT